MKSVPFRIRVGRALRKRREATGMSQESFAPLVRMHRSKYAAVERGTQNIRVTTLENICRALKVSMWRVLKEAEEEPS